MIYSFLFFQAFFGVFDGHGGREAVDFVTEKLGKNILAVLPELEETENQLELAIRAGYRTTDSQLLGQVWCTMQKIKPILSKLFGYE